MKIFFRVALLGLLLGALLGCGGNGGGGTISGKVFDWITGVGISGATVVFGSYSGTTDLSGAYSITVPGSVSSVDGVFAAFKGLEYTFLAAGGISVDPATDPVYNIGLGPTNPSGYPGINLSGTIRDNTGAELSDGTGLGFDFINANGGQQYVAEDYGLVGYSLNTKTFGSGCFVSLVARDQPNPFEAPRLQFYLQDQGLSVDRNDYHLTQPPDVDYTTVTVNGTDGTMFHGCLVAPNGGWVGVTGGEFSGSSNGTLKLYNPDSFQMGWFTMTDETDTPAPGERTLKFSAAILPFSGTINLPAAYTHDAPSGAVDGTRVNWNAGTGTLSFDAVDGANGYMIILLDNGGHSSTMFSISSSIAFPSKLVTDILDAGAGWDLTVWPMYSPQATPETLVDLSLSWDLTGSPASAMRMECQFAAIGTDLTKADAIP